MKRPPSGKKPVIGLAGGIGSGKSLVAQIMRDLGAVVLDADATTHEVLNEAEVIRTLSEWWGRSVVDDEGRIDRRRVAEIVFRNTAERQRLEELIHPRIYARWDAVLQSSSDVGGSVRAVVVDAPLLFEAKLDAICDVIVFVESDEATRMQRVAEKRGWTGDELVRREKMQKTLDSKRTRADYIVENNSSVYDLRRKVEGIFSAVIPG